MKCHAAEDYLERICLGEDCGDIVEDLAVHLESCASCRAVRDELQLTTALELSRIKKDDNDGFRLAREAVAVEAERTRRLKKRTRVVGHILKAAAVFAVVCCVLAALFMNQTPEQWEEPAQSRLEVKWTTSEIGDKIAANRPLVSGSKVFVLRNHSNMRFVAALDRETGVEKWISDFPTISTPLLGDGNLLTWRRVNGRIRLTAIDLGTGKELWGYEPHIGRGLWRSPPSAVVDSHIISWSIGRQIWALDASSGEVRWQRKINTGRGKLSPPLIVEGRVAVADGRTLYLLGADEGEVSQKITYSMTARVVPRPIIDGSGDHVYISQHAAGKQGRLYCCDLMEGKLLWSQQTKRPLSFQVVHNRAYVRSNVIQAFDCGTGHLMWTNDVDGCSPVSVDANRVYVMRSKDKHEIVALNSATGERDAVFTLPDGSCAGMTIADGSSYLASRYGRIYALALPH